jgi:hypothetical protein
MSEWPTQDHPLISWFCYVAAGDSKLERRARLSKCPKELREDVMQRVTHFFEERNKAMKGT